MFTDPAHVRADDPGRVEGNVVFAYLRAFDPDAAAVGALENRYRHGGLGDVVVKRRLEELLETVIAPIRERRAELAREPGIARAVLVRGSARTRDTAASVLADVRSTFAIESF
jgi:tryptophanyl-tRNA synthetase